MLVVSVASRVMISIIMDYDSIHVQLILTKKTPFIIYFSSYMYQNYRKLVVVSPRLPVKYPQLPARMIGQITGIVLGIQCQELSFYFVHSQGALPIKLCTRKLLHAPSQYIAIINGSKNVHTPGAHLQKSCTLPWKCARRVQGAPLISDTGIV